MAKSSEGLAFQADFQSVNQKLCVFLETVATARKHFSKLNSEVLHIPLNDGGSIVKLTMFESLFDDDFASHVKHLTKMSSKLESADTSPITLRKLKMNIGGSVFNGETSFNKLKRIHAEVVVPSINQISELKEFATKFKKLKEDQMSVFKGTEQKDGGGTKNALISKLKAFLADEARKAMFDSELETDPGILLSHLESIESSLQEVCEVTCGYEEALQTVVKKMKEMKKEEKEDAILEYLSDIKDEVRKLAQQCENISQNN